MKIDDSLKFNFKVPKPDFEGLGPRVGANFPEPITDTVKRVMSLVTVGQLIM